MKANRKWFERTFPDRFKKQEVASSLDSSLTTLHSGKVQPLTLIRRQPLNGGTFPEWRLVRFVKRK